MLIEQAGTKTTATVHFKATEASRIYMDILIYQPNKFNSPTQQLQMPIGNGLSSSPSSSRSLPLSFVRPFCGDHITTPSPAAVWISVHTLAKEHRLFMANRKRTTWKEPSIYRIIKRTDMHTQTLQQYSLHLTKHCSVILGEQGLGQQCAWEIVGSCPKLCFYDCPL